MSLAPCHTACRWQDQDLSQNSLQENSAGWHAGRVEGAAGGHSVDFWMQSGGCSSGLLLQLKLSCRPGDDILSVHSLTC